LFIHISINFNYIHIDHHTNQENHYTDPEPKPIVFQDIYVGADRFGIENISSEGWGLFFVHGGVMIGPGNPGR